MASSLVDAHVHLWDLARQPYPWLAEHPRLDRTHGLKRFAEAAQGAAQVERFVFVECTVSFDDEVAREEVRWVHALAEEDARLQGIVAHASLEKGAAVRSHLEWLAEQPLVRGVRRLLQDEPADFCLQPSFVEGVRELAAFDFTFDACIYHHQLPQFIELVRQCPEVQFVLDHLGKPPIRDGQVDPWRARIRTLAGCPNVVCKASGALTEADPDSPAAEAVRPYLKHVIEAFGPDRVLFGSDWPVLTLAGTYPAWVEIVRDVVSGYTPAEQQRLFGETAERVYRLEEKQ